MYKFKLGPEPDTNKCRTRRAGAVIPVAGREMFYCGIDYGECRYAMQLGWDYICKHADNASFCTLEGEEEELVEANKSDSFASEENLRQ